MEDENNNYQVDNDDPITNESYETDAITPPLSPPSSFLSASSSSTLSPLSPTFPPQKFSHNHRNHHNHKDRPITLDIANTDKSTLDSILTTTSHLHLQTLTKTTNADKNINKSPEEIKAQKKYRRYGFLGVNIRQQQDIKLQSISQEVAYEE